MLKSIFGSKNNYYRTKTFTYFIPAPPNRKTGYQEKEFDSLSHQIALMGFDIINIQSSAYANNDKCGMWVVCLLGASTKEIFDQEILFDSLDSAQVSSVPLDPDIIHE